MPNTIIKKAVPTEAEIAVKRVEKNNLTGVCNRYNKF